jgi:hypothetical protein
MKENEDKEDGFGGEIKEQKGRGRYVIANRDLQPGEVVLRSKSIAVAVCENYKFTICSTCFKALPTSTTHSRSTSKYLMDIN